MLNRPQLITYADRLAGDLRGVAQMLRGPLAGAFGGVHVLPFFVPIDGADAGFDPADHTTVDPRVGDWDDIVDLAGDHEVMADLIINHVSVGKDWERLIFCGINPNEGDVRFVFITKADFEAHLESDKCYFNVQQGGKKVGNDDYICTNVAALLECEFVKDIAEW